VIETEILIIGQGISGTWLSYWLDKAGKDFIILDDPSASAPSRVAAGVINPVTGRRYAVTWLAETLLPFSMEAYSALGRRISADIIREKNIIDFFPTAQMRNSFLERIPENEYLARCEDEDRFSPWLHYELGCGFIRPVYVADLQQTLEGWRSLEVNKERIRKERFDEKDLELVNNKVVYRGIRADRIIFCDGGQGSTLSWFRKLPFALNKGEALLVEIGGLPESHLYKKGMVVVPLGPPGLFWVGASYQWEYDHPHPTEAFRSQAENFLRGFLRLPFRVLEHRASIRPATLERRPFAGFHPAEPRIGILNGMGTKGCSLAPYFAKQLSDQLDGHKSLHPNADIKRFTRLLTTTS
jgi:glycine/D-amino acid oxidase-like deaminating enzyme